MSRAATDLPNLYVPGRIDKSELPSIYANATALLFPTVKEGCPNVVMESLASGTPVIGYEATSMPELVRSDRTGVLVEADDIDALTEAVRSFPQRDVRTMGERAREYVLENHRFEIIAEDYMTAYENTLGSEMGE